MTKESHSEKAIEPDIAREKLLDRVRKLYAMSSQTEESPHEAEIALRRCEKLMSKYGIQESDLHTSDFDAAVFHQSKRISRHVNYLAGAVANLLGVVVVNTNGTLDFRGYSVDVPVAKLTFDYLMDALEKSLRKRKQSGEVCAGRMASQDYRFAYAVAVFKRAKVIAAERDSTAMKTSGTTALTVRKVEQIWANCMDGVARRKQRRFLRRRSEADAVGRRDGENVSLNSQVHSGSSRSRIALS